MKIHKNTSQWNDTGGTFEAGVMFKAGDRRLAELQAIDPMKIEYRSLAAAVLECIEANPNGYKGSELWDPPTGWMRTIHYEITQRLKLKDWENLVIVPSLKTSADIHHGIDFMVVYHQPETDRDVIVTVDLSLRKKENFKADILVTDTGTTPNPTYFDAPARDIPSIDTSDMAKEQAADADEFTRERRRKAVGQCIADVIQEKLEKEDPHYGQTIKAIGGTMHRGIEELLETTKG